MYEGRIFRFVLFVVAYQIALVPCLLTVFLAS